MGSPTRFPYGLSNMAKETVFGQMGQLNPAKFITYFNDFLDYVANDWTITNVGTTPTQALTNVNGGALLLTMAATDDSSSFLDKKGEFILPASGKKLFFETRFAVSDATQSDWVVGLQVTDTTPLDVTDGIYFQKDDGDAFIDFYVSKNATTGRSTSTNIATAAAADVYMTLGFYFDGKRYVQLFKDGVQLITVDLTTTLTTYLPDTTLTISFGVQNGEAVAKTMSMDYIFVAQER